VAGIHHIPEVAGRASVASAVFERAVVHGETQVVRHAMTVQLLHDGGDEEEGVVQGLHVFEAAEASSS